jgi:hypothetical protein
LLGKQFDGCDQLLDISASALLPQEIVSEPLLLGDPAHRAVS